MDLAFGREPVWLVALPVPPAHPSWPCQAPAQGGRRCWVQPGLYMLQGMSENTLARPQGFVPPREHRFPLPHQRARVPSHLRPSGPAAGGLRKVRARERRVLLLQG